MHYVKIKWQQFLLTLQDSNGFTNNVRFIVGIWFEIFYSCYYDTYKHLLCQESWMRCFATLENINKL